jgi:hypothetical protein
MNTRINDYGSSSKKQQEFAEYSNGPYIGIIVNHLDNQKMGRLEVVLVRTGGANTELSDSAKIPVDYAPAFFGNTPYTSTDPNNRLSSSTQSSYGMWFVPPDVGSRVLIMFVEGNRSSGYWFACVPEPGINHMVPGIAASRNVELTPQEKNKLGTDFVPVAEVNRKLKGQTKDDIDKIKKPLHPFTLRLASQGLLKDPIRGVTTSGARRNVPSSVFGISTPGPPVTGKNSKKAKVGPKNNTFEVPAERHGGTQFVMDDGYIGKDERTGAEGILDELVRIRTRTGHQILLHNSSDLIYICNSRGTAWLEFTSDGKIDIFAADSVSIHSEEDFNFRADRDINMEAGNNVNIVAARGAMHLEAGSLIEGFAGLDVNWTAKSHFNVSVLGRIRMTTLTNPLDPLNSGIDLYSTTGNFNLYTTRGIKMQTLTNIDLKSTLGLNAIVGTSTSFSTAGSFSVNTIGSNFIKSGVANVFDTTGTHIERAVFIDMNGPTPAPQPVTAATNIAAALDLLQLLPEAATNVSVLDTFVLPYREADKNATADMQKGWENNNYYRQPDIRSIMKRVPTHEPWDHHENIAPEEFKPEKTDRGG